MALDPAIEEQLSEIIEQEKEMGLGDEAAKLEHVVEDEGEAPAAGGALEASAGADASKTDEIPAAEPTS